MGPVVTVPVGGPVGALLEVLHIDVELVGLLVSDDVQEVVASPELRLQVPEARLILVPVPVEVHLRQDATNDMALEVPT